MKGIVKWFDPVKGFGFIEREDRTGDVFVHYSGIASGGKPGRKVLYENDPVEFDLSSNPHNQKLCAVNVQVKT